MSSSQKTPRNTYSWGIIGCGRVSNDFCNALTGYQRAKIVACAARNQSSAKAFATKYDIPRYYDSYEQVAKDDQIDVVYVGTIHPTHLQNVLLCLENGKHVLCEKPMGINLSETKAMIDCARRNKRFLLEGLWSRYFPAVIQCKSWMDEGQIGSPMCMLCDFGLARSSPKQSPTTWKNELVGGSFMGLGPYIIDPLLRVFGARYPSKISAVGCIDDKYKVDTVVAVNVLYEDTNQYAQISCNSFVKTAEECHIVGTKGRIKLVSPQHCPTVVELYMTSGREQKLVQRKEFPVDGIAEFKYKNGFIFPNSEGFLYEIEEVTRCLDEGLLESNGYKWQEMLLNSRMSDEIRRQIGLRYAQDNVQQHSKL